MKSKILKVILLIAITALILPGCGNSTPEAVSESKESTVQTDKPAEEAKIEIFSQKPENVEVLNEIIAKFTSDNPNIKVALTSSPDAAKVLITRISTNDIPDVVNIFPTTSVYKNMMEEGIFLDLTNETFMKNVSQGTVDLIKYEDKAYAVPITVNAYGLYYNKDIFAKYALEPPKTLEELYSICDKLKANGVQPFVFMDKDAAAFGQQGERLLGGSVNHEIWTLTEKVAKGEASFTTEKDMRLLAETLLKIREYGPKNTLGVGSDQANDDFANGRAAMIPNGTWGLSTYKKLNPSINVGVICFPSISGIEAYTSGTVDTAFAIASTTKYPEASKKFIEFFTSKDISQMYCDKDKNPNLVSRVDYSVAELGDINKMINDGKFSLIPTSYWPAGYRDEWQMKLQELVAKKDVDAFLKAADDITKRYYNK